MSHYIGRFAPSPTGPLHLGSLVTALASWCDARWHNGQWLVRIEDIDTQRCNAQLGEEMLKILGRFGLIPDATPIWQSQQQDHYSMALEQLLAEGKAYPCACTRKEIADSQTQNTLLRQRHQTLVYPNTCRPCYGGLKGKTPRAWRLQVPDTGQDCIRFEDRIQGEQTQCLADEVGDFVLKRADGLWAYQLAVVVDDGLQGVTDIVRGEDLLDSTARQLYLQSQLGLPHPRYLHIPVVYNEQGEKLSKQSGAIGLNIATEADILKNLQAAASHLGLLENQYEAKHESNISALLNKLVIAWGNHYLLSNLTRKARTFTWHCTYP